MGGKKGFSQILVILLTAVVIAGVSGLVIYKTKTSQNEKKETPKTMIKIATPSSQPLTATPSPTKTVTKPVVPPPIPPKVLPPTTGMISVHLSDSTSQTCQYAGYCFDGGIDKPIKAPGFKVRVSNPDTKYSTENQSVTSDWTVKDLVPGRFHVDVWASSGSYGTRASDCQNCPNNQSTTDSDCGVVFDLKAGANPRVLCKFQNYKPDFSQSTPPPPPPSGDTSPPTTHISYPQSGGTITYRTDGKVCAIASAPTDDKSSWNDIQTDYAFDSGGWYGYATNRPYLCADSLSNGAHTLRYHSKDQAGNEESTQTLSFTVDIAGN